MYSRDSNGNQYHVLLSDSKVNALTRVFQLLFLYVIHFYPGLLRIRVLW